MHPSPAPLHCDYLCIAGAPGTVAIVLATRIHLLHLFLARLHLCCDYLRIAGAPSSTLQHRTGAGAGAGSTRAGGARAGARTGTRTAACAGGARAG